MRPLFLPSNKYCLLNMRLIYMYESQKRGTSGLFITAMTFIEPRPVWFLALVE